MTLKSAAVKPRRDGAGARLRRALVTLHLVLGLTAGLLLSLTGLTGSLLVFRHEINGLLESGLRRAAPGGAEPAPLENVVAAVRRRDPTAKIQHLFLAEGPQDTHEVWLAGSERRIYVDPYTAKVLGEREETSTLTGWLFALHTKLLSGESGERVVGYGGIALLALSVSGVVLWWPSRLRQLPDRLRIKWRGVSWLRINYDLHRTGGFYAATLLSLLALTGSSLVFDDWFKAAAFRITGSSLPAPPPKLAGDASSPAALAPLGTLLAGADAALPGGTLRRVSFPKKTGAPVVVRKRLPGDLHPNGMSYIYLDPHTGAVLRANHAADAPAGQRLLNLRYPLHIGQWGGLLSRILHALAGLMPAVLFVTGLRMWWVRQRKQNAQRQHTSPQSVPPV